MCVLHVASWQISHSNCNSGKATFYSCVCVCYMLQAGRSPIHKTGSTKLQHWQSNILQLCVCVLHVASWQISHSKDRLYLTATPAEQHSTVVRVAHCKLADLPVKRQALPNCNSGRATFYSCMCVCCMLQASRSPIHKTGSTKLQQEQSKNCTVRNNK